MLEPSHFPARPTRMLRAVLAWAVLLGLALAPYPQRRQRRQVGTV